MWFETKKIRIVVSHYNVLFSFLILDGDRNDLYVKRENVYVSMWLGIRPIDNPNYNIPFRFIDNFNKKLNIWQKKTLISSRII